MEGTSGSVVDAVHKSLSADGVGAPHREQISTTSSRNKKGLLGRDGKRLTKWCKSILTNKLVILILVSMRDFSPCFFKGRSRR